MPYECLVYGDEFRNNKNLYHYTTLECLKKITETKTLLFNRCDKLNDLIEGTRSEVKYYVSCFTYCKNESIPMWYIYTSGKTNSSKCDIGIRLCIENHDFFTGTVFLDPIKREKTYSVDYFGGIMCGITIYDNKNKDRKPNQGTMNSNASIKCRLTNVNDLGLRGKGTAWDYEKEARFYTLDSDLDADKIFLSLEDSFFEKLKITISPLLTDEQIERAEKEVHNLLGEGRCQTSELKGTIRIDK